MAYINKKEVLFSPKINAIEAKLGAVTLTSNRTYYAKDDGFDGYKTVNVDTSEAYPLYDENFTQNGTFSPPEGYYGFGIINVEVPTRSPSDLTATYDESTKTLTLGATAGTLAAEYDADTDTTTISLE